MSSITLPKYNSGSRLLGASATALVVTFGLFVLMDKLTSSDEVTSGATEQGPIVDMWYQEKPDAPPPEKKLPVIKPKIKQPPTTPELPSDEPDMSSKNSTFAIQIPTTDGIGTGLGGNAMSNLPAQPVVRMQPQYPRQAAMDGIEGWVKLIFNIDATGQVTDVKVLDSYPKRIFDKAARKALLKWKYKPQLIAGKPVAEEGLQIVLDFSLDKQ